jgi:hypothetical protein
MAIIYSHFFLKKFYTCFQYDAVFPLLVWIARLGPIGIVEFATRSAATTTVSRQVATLESVSLVARRPGPKIVACARSFITEGGKAMTDAVDAAREKLARIICADWDA